MPRRKGTRVAARRTKQTLKDANLDTSMTAEERQHKLHIFMEDFKTEVEARIQSIKQREKKVLDRIVNQYQVELVKLPMHVRTMPLTEFFACEGESTSVIQQIPLAPMSSISQSLASIPDTRKPLIDINSKNIEPQTPAHSDTAQKIEPPTTGRVLRTRKNQKQANPTPAPATRSTRKKQAVNNQFATPASHMNTFAFATPAVTPKFDPRLPFTPGLMRDPRQGERIMSMSGSPLTNKNATAINSGSIQVLIPAGSGETLHIDSQFSMSPNSISGLDNVAKKNLILLQQKLASLLKAVKTT